MDEGLELSDEVRELFLAGKLDVLLAHFAQVGADALREEHARRNRDWQRANRTTPEYKERRNQAQRDRYATDPGYRDEIKSKTLSRHHEKYANNPEYREAHKARSRNRHATMLRDDPSYREWKRQYNREYYERKKAEREAQENND